MRIEAEGQELVLQNKSGDYVIIPVKYRQEVLGMIKDGCHNCIDDLVATLPTSKDYAKDGTVVKPEDPPGKDEKNKVIYVDDANDPALKSYNDSLQAYQKYNSRIPKYTEWEEIGRKETWTNNGAKVEYEKLVKMQEDLNKVFRDKSSKFLPELKQTNEDEWYRLWRNAQFYKDYVAETDNFDNRQYYLKTKHILVEPEYKKVKTGKDELILSEDEYKKGFTYLNLKPDSYEINKYNPTEDQAYIDRDREEYEGKYGTSLRDTERRQLVIDRAFDPNAEIREYFPLFKKPATTVILKGTKKYDNAKKQEELKAAGLYQGDIDGIWGSKSEKAWKEFSSKQQVESVGKSQNSSTKVQESKKEAAGARVYQLPWMDESQRYRFADDKGKVKSVSKQEYEKLKQKYPETEDGFDQRAKATTDRYRNLNWVQRGLKPNKYPVINNADGSVSTHRLSYVEADGKFYVYPTIIQDKKGKLIEMDGKAAADYAFKTKTAIPFKTEAEAEYYSRNGLIKH